jgi:hypothetical protein
MSSEDNSGKILSLILLVVIIGAIVGGALLYPQYKLYRMEMDGKAALAEAEWTKKIQIEESKGKLEAEKYNRETELIKANTEAEANKIVSGSLDPLYIRYKMVEKMTDANTQVIYVPTEGGIPLLEAGRNTQPAPTATA